MEKVEGVIFLCLVMYHSEWDIPKRKMYYLEWDIGSIKYIIIYFLFGPSTNRKSHILPPSQLSWVVYLFGMYQLSWVISFFDKKKYWITLTLFNYLLYSLYIFTILFFSSTFPYSKILTQLSCNGGSNIYTYFYKIKYTLVQISIFTRSTLIRKLNGSPNFLTYNTTK